MTYLNVAIAYVNLTPTVPAQNFEETVEWYGRLLGREPDLVDADGCVGWRLAEAGGLRICRQNGRTGGATIMLGLDDLDAELARLRNSDIEAQAFSLPSSRLRLAELNDPAGNIVVLSEVTERRSLART